MAASASRFAPWLGMIAGPLCLALHQQGFATLLHFDCRQGSPTKGLLSFAVLATVIVISGFVSWRSRLASELQHFIAVLSTLAAALFFLAILLQTAATIILPGCGP